MRNGYLTNRTTRSETRAHEGGGGGVGVGGAVDAKQHIQLNPAVPTLDNGHF